MYTPDLNSLRANDIVQRIKNDAGLAVSGGDANY
jgi:hypothetical protein